MMFDMIRNFQYYSPSVPNMSGGCELQVTGTRPCSKHGYLGLHLVARP
jgi:hypothetical protein